MKKIKNVDLEFIYSESYPAGMDKEEAEEMGDVIKYVSEIKVIKDGKHIKSIEPMMYNSEYLQGETPEDEFTMLHISKHTEKEIDQSKGD